MIILNVGGGQMFHADYFVIIMYNLRMSNSFLQFEHIMFAQT